MFYWSFYGIILFVWNFGGNYSFRRIFPVKNRLESNNTVGPSTKYKTLFHFINGQLFLYIHSKDIKQSKKIILKNFGFLIGGRLLINELKDFLSGLDKAGLNYTIIKPFEQRQRKMTFLKYDDHYI